MFLSLAAALWLAAPGAVRASGDAAAWEQTRSLERFRQLLAHSPFSLPTAEQNSPLAERYALTGIVSVGGVDQVFVFDRTDQSRELVGRSPNAKGMSLVSVIRDTGSTPKASISIGGESGTIGFLEAGAQQAAPQPAQAQPGSPAFQPQAAQAGAQNPALPPLPQNPSASGRRIIKRPPINAPAPAIPHP